MTSHLDNSDAELLKLTRELDEHHRDTENRRNTAFADLSEAFASELGKIRHATHVAASRRNFLRGGIVSAGVLGGGLILAACGSDSSSSAAAGGTDSGSGSAAGSSSLSGDLAVAQLAASLEILAVNTYQTALSAAGKGAFGAVPPSFGTFAQTAMSQHKDHGDAWNGALQKNGQAAVTTPNPKYGKIVSDAVPTLKTIADVAKLALTLETVALETYTAGSGLVTDKANRGVALTIAPVEAQHVAILNFVLGQYPVPDSFIKTDMAAGLDSLKG